jgi:uncharacterized glyoxalase superfamily protein PhnB
MITGMIPVLSCADIQGEHDFLVRAFGFEPGGVVSDDKGVVVHGEVHAGDLTIWLHAEGESFRLASARSMPKQSGGLVVYVDDVDAHYEAAKAAGAEVETPPRDQSYGQREYGARSLEGHRWWFAQKL